MFSFTLINHYYFPFIYYLFVVSIYLFLFFNYSWQVYFWLKTFPCLNRSLKSDSIRVGWHNSQFFSVSQSTYVTEVYLLKLEV